MTELDPATTALLRRRLPGWIALAGLLAALNYAGNLASETEPDREILYRWSTAAAGAIQFGIILLVVLLLARGAFEAQRGGRRYRHGRRRHRFQSSHPRDHSKSPSRAASRLMASLMRRSTVRTLMPSSSAISR